MALTDKQVDALLEYLNSLEDSSIMDAIIEFCDDNDSYDWASGVTRIAVWHKDWDFVIKIPREDTTTDHCAIEVQHYESAKKYHVERICLPIELFVTLDNGTKLYKQTRYSFDTRTGYDKDYHHYLNRRSCTGNHAITRKVFISCRWLSRADMKWLERIIQLYGKKFMRSMEAWLDENKINDLHNCNTGWYKNRPILLDYAGFHD